MAARRLRDNAHQVSVYLRSEVMIRCGAAWCSVGMVICFAQSCAG